MKNVIFIFCLFLTVICLASCAPKQGKNYPEIIKTDVSATDVVKIFLDSLKADDFGTAYDQIYVVSADKEGYVSRMKLIQEETDASLVNYKILGTQLFRDTAIVVAELETERTIDGGVEKKFTRNKYDLKLFDNKTWKITKDSCIENCQ